MTVPAFTTPAELAHASGFNERLLRRKARALGACRILGKTMVLTDDDVATVLEALRPCPSPSIDAAKSGTIAAPLPDGDYEALVALRTKQQRSGSPPKRKPAAGKVISMVRGRS